MGEGSPRGGRLSILGPPGSGKSTLSRLIAARLEAPVISIGELLRRAAERDPETLATIERGGFVSDATSWTAMLPALEAAGARYVLDGFPRTAGQAIRLAESPYGPPDVAVVLHVPPATLATRLDIRRRNDDYPTAIGKRIALYEAHLEAVLRQLGTTSAAVHIDASGDAPQTADAIESALSELDASAAAPQSSRHWEEE